jgi:hypothetical protein
MPSFLKKNAMIIFYVSETYSCDFNKYTLQYIAKLGEIRSAVKAEEDMEFETVPGILPSIS